MKLKILIICILLPLGRIQAQDSIPKKIDPTNPKKILQIPIPTYYEIPEKMPAPEHSVNQDYYLPLLSFPIDYQEEMPKPAHFQEQKPSQKLNNLIHFGLGSYLSPRFDLHYLPKHEKLGINISHNQYFNGAKDGKNSASSDTNLGVFGSFVKSSKQFNFEIIAKQKTVHFYGYDTPIESVILSEIRQNYKNLNANLSFSNLDFASKFKYNSGLHLWFWTDNFGFSELGFAPKINLFYRLNDEQKLNFGATGQTIFNSDSINYTRNSYSVNGNYEKQTFNFRAKIGVRVGVDLEEMTSKILIFPDINLEYDAIAEKLTLFLKSEGQIQTKNKANLTVENPFLNPNFQARNQYQIAETETGFRGNLSQEFNFEMAFFYGIYERFYVFVNDDIFIEKFNLITDNHKVTNFGFHANLTYLHKKIKSNLHLKFQKFQTHFLAEAWHLPQREIQWKISYQHPKFIPTIGLDYLGKIPFYDVFLGNTQYLPDMTNIQLKGKYFPSKKSSILLEINNLINKKYEDFAQYEALGLEAVLGVNFRF